MKILDRERYWSFLKAYLIAFVSLVGLYIIIDAFANLDEFEEHSDSTVQLFTNMGQFYLIRMSLFFDQLCGIITMMAAIFTVTWMQKNNELLAMLAAGISTRRVVRPVLISALLVSSLSVVNQELIMPKLAGPLQLTQDDDGKIPLKVNPSFDSNGINIGGERADRETKSIDKVTVTIPIAVAGELLEIQAREARYVPEGDSTGPHSGGWLIWGAKFLMAPKSKSMEKQTRGLLVEVADPSPYAPPKDKISAKPGVAVHFLKTDLTFTTLTRKPRWFQFAPTLELIRGLSDPTNLADKSEILIFLHARMIRPLLSFNLMLLSLPLVLGGAGRNMFVNLGMSLGTSGIFYSFNFMSQYLGGHGVYPAELAAWLPLIIFGTIAVARWDTIRT